MGGTFCMVFVRSEEDNSEAGSGRGKSAAGGSAVPAKQQRRPPRFVLPHGYQATYKVKRIFDSFNFNESLRPASWWAREIGPDEHP
jgi:hypothetical protein